MKPMEIGDDIFVRWIKPGEVYMSYEFIRWIGENPVDLIGREITIAYYKITAYEYDDANKLFKCHAVSINDDAIKWINGEK